MHYILERLLLVHYILFLVNYQPLIHCVCIILFCNIINSRIYFLICKKKNYTLFVYSIVLNTNYLFRISLQDLSKVQLSIVIHTKSMLKISFLVQRKDPKISRNICVFLSRHYAVTETSGFLVFSFTIFLPTTTANTQQTRFTHESKLNETERNASSSS